MKYISYTFKLVSTSDNFNLEIYNELPSKVGDTFEITRYDLSQIEDKVYFNTDPNNNKLLVLELIEVFYDNRTNAGSITLEYISETVNEYKSMKAFIENIH